jgi:hypothetical protein
MVKAHCSACHGAVLVSEIEAETFEGFMCQWCHEKAQLAATAEFGESAARDFRSDRVNLNGRILGIARIRVA